MIILPAAATDTAPLIDFAWIGRNLDLIWTQLVQHLILTAVPMVIGLAIAAPLSLAAIYWPRSYNPVIGIFGILFTIPSLALFVLMIPLTGLSSWTAIVPLTIYTQLILIRNATEGLRGVDRDVREAAAAMGYTPLRQIITVDAPIALPVIFAGIRIATITTIGLVTVSALVGQGGLGQLFTDGFVRQFPTPLLVGLFLVVVLAVLCDLSLLMIQRWLTPWARTARS